MSIDLVRAAGISLVELLVAMTIGLFLVGGATTVLIKNKQQFIIEEETSYIQENARFVFDQLSYDVRMAGYFGCNIAGSLSNTLNGSSTSASFSSLGIKGFEYSERTDSDFPATINPLIAAGTDMIIVNRGAQDDSIVVTGHSPSSATIHLSGPNALTDGEVLVMTTPDCNHTAIFQMSGPSSTSPSTVVHNSGGSVSPGNCRKALTATSTGGSYYCGSASEPGPSVTGLAFPPGSSLMRFSTSAYFIGTSTITGLPTLYRMGLQVSGGSSVTDVQELVSGVEDMEILYGVDSDATADGQIDRYYSADNIPADIATVGNTVAWDRVLATRITLILRSNREVFGAATSVDLGGGYTFNNRYMRQKITTTVRVRNRGLGV